MVEKSGMQIVERRLLAAEQTFGDEDLTVCCRSKAPIQNCRKLSLPSVGYQEVVIVSNGR